MSKEEEKKAALDALRSAQRQYDTVTERMTDYKELFRDDRDEAVKAAIRVGVSKKDIADVLAVSPQWLNRLLRGEAYRRKTDHKE